MATARFTLLVILYSVGEVSGDCGTLPVLTQANPVGYNATTSPVSTEVKYKCVEGYEFNTGYDNKTVTCLDSDQWSAITECQKISCPPLPTDAILSSSNRKYGDSVTMSCADTLNFRVPGAPVGSSLTVTCTADKTWDLFDSSNEQGCITIECVNPMPNSVGNNDNVAIGSKAEFTCNYGHFYDDDSLTKEFECNAAGEWEIGGEDNITCNARECDDLATGYGLNNLKIISKTRFIGEDVKVACIEGHEFNDSSIEKKVMCQANQTYSYIPFDCIARFCSPVANITFGNVSSTDNQYPSIVNFTCNSPYMFPDGSTWRISQCNKYGKWTEKIPDCGDELGIGGDYEKVNVNAKGADTYGIISLSIIGVMISAAVILDIVTFGMQIGFLKRNLNCVDPEDKEEDLESLDGEILMRASFLSLGKGRVTPAPSTVDLSHLNESQPTGLNKEEDVDVVDEELKKLEDEEAEAIRKSSVPRTRLKSAKTSIQKALTRVNNGRPLTRIRMFSPVKKNDFAMAGLPLGADNYGKVIELRPPSPTSEESETESEYTDDDDDSEIDEKQEAEETV